MPLQLRSRMGAEEVELLEELLILEGIMFDPNLTGNLESDYDDVSSKIVSSLQQAVEELLVTVEEVRRMSYIASLSDS